MASVRKRPNERDSGAVLLGDKCIIDAGVELGYCGGRNHRRDRLTIGDGARIRTGTVIYAGTTIGQRFETGHNVVIREENVIDDDVSIWNNSVIDYGCRIGKRVKIHTNVYVAQFTIIEDEVFIAPGVTIANDIHPGCPYSKQCMKGPTIKRSAQIGVNATILPRVTIGEYAVIGAGSVVTKDVPAYSVCYGNPALSRGDVRALKCTTGLTDVPYPHLKGEAGEVAAGAIG